MKKRLLAVVLVVTVCASLAGCGSTAKEVQKSTETAMVENAGTEETEMADVMRKEIQVTSESLTDDGMWITKINAEKAKPAGENMTPQISFDAVEGAGCYAVYMIDTTASNWLHWRACGVTETVLDAGMELENSKYIGPYPPSGTHEYQVVVYALKAEPDSYPGSFNAANRKAEDMEEELDVSGGVTGNILGKGSITGTVISGGEEVTK